MGRIRSIKPEFFRNEELARHHPLCRLLFEGLWTEADREGRLEDRPIRLKPIILPYDACDLDALLTELDEAGFIVRYECEGVRIIQVVNFLKHQRPHPKEAPSILPPPTLECCRENSRRAVEKNGKMRGSGDLWKEVSGREGDGAAAPRTRRTRVADDFPLTPIRRAYAVGHGVADADVEWEKFSDYHRARGSVMLDWDAAWRLWCRNYTRFAGNSVGRPAGRAQERQRRNVVNLREFTEGVS